MCGIICYNGALNAGPIILEGLKKLEYRGYDSFGVCLKDEKIDKLHTFKKKGCISENNDFKTINSHIGIGHTRWATHGEPNDMNAHPHSDCKNNISIVHNGIIENYVSIKKILVDKGHKIISDTDSEVLAHLIEELYEGNLKESVRKAILLIEGTFGIAVMHKSHNEIILARKGSPLVIGLCDTGLIAASDITPLIEHTKKVIYMNDGELATITDKDYSIEDFKGTIIDKKIEEIKWNIESIEKNGYKHFMLKEIHEQPESIMNVLRGRIINNRIKLTLNQNFMSPKNFGRIIILACGTSWHSGLIGKYFIEELTRIPVEVDYASEFRYRNPVLTKNDLVIVISQSGETADTLAALREAKKHGSQTLGIINVVGSTIAREVDSGIYLHAGPEIGVASTKAFTCQVTALLLLALYIRQEQGQELDKELINSLIKLPEYVSIALKSQDSVKIIAEKFHKVNNFLFLGRDINFPVAIEGALKLKEIAYIHAEGYPAAEMKHGPIALIDSDMPVVVVATKNNLSNKILSNIQEVKSRNGQIIAIVDDDNTEISTLVQNQIVVPHVSKFISPIINVIPLQFLAYHIADIKGLDVDKPRNLAKSVTVE
ncbi:MAG: glutamine--fructose-6-phosphate transaminase (isomerizing) [Candidatus Woesearchaeota archaeon]